MKSQANKTLFLRKLSILELNTKELKFIIGGSITLNQDQEYEMPTSNNTVSTRICVPGGGLTN